jgi:hypothetical protein
MLKNNVSRVAHTTYTYKPVDGETISLTTKNYAEFNAEVADKTFLVWIDDMNARQFLDLESAKEVRDFFQLLVDILEDIK